MLRLNHYPKAWERRNWELREITLKFLKVSSQYLHRTKRTETFSRKCENFFESNSSLTDLFGQIPTTSHLPHLLKVPEEITKFAFENNLVKH